MTISESSALPQLKTPHYSSTPVKNPWVSGGDSTGVLDRTAEVAEDVLDFDEGLTRRQFQSPARYYSVIRDCSGRLTVQFTPRAREYARGVPLIYKIKQLSQPNFDYNSDDDGEKDSATDYRYIPISEERVEPAKIGLTQQGFVKRMQQHLSCANHPERDRGKGALYDAMRDPESQFVVGVVTTLDEGYDADTDEKKELGELESDVIEDHNSIASGYNERLGGGGGSIAREEEDFTELPPESFRTPTKPGYPIRYRRGKTSRAKKKRLYVDVTPRGRKQRYVVYGFRRDDGKWLIGETEQRFIDRIYGYHYDFNNPHKDRGQRPLPRAVRMEPSRFRVYILYQGPHVKQMESLWIKAKDAIEEGFNQVGGGGGPSSSRNY